VSNSSAQARCSWSARGGALSLCTIVLPTGGCRPWSGRFPEILDAWNKPSDAAEQKHEPSASPPASDLEVVLAAPGGWSRTPPALDPAEDPPRWRWRHAALEELLAAGENTKALRAALRSKNSLVATNAAIALGRDGQPAGKDLLLAAVRSVQFDLPLRRAAAEALGGLDAREAVEPLGELVDQYGQWRGPRRRTYRPELHAELLCALARHVDPADDPRFEAALQSPSAEVRREAIGAWAAGRRGELPKAALDLAADPAAQVRAAAIRAIAARRPAGATTHLAAGARDFNVRVRLAAIAGLGQIGTSEAVAVLGEVLGERSETLRAAAVRALAAAGAKERVLDAADDDAWQVREAVAEALARWPGDAQAKLALKLLDDRSPQVQAAVVRATDAWPLAEAGPVLLAAMEKSTLETRNGAAERLVDRWAPAEAFPQRGPPERRAASLAQLRRQFAQEHGTSLPPEAVAPAEQVEVTEMMIAQAAELVARLADPRLASSDRQPVLEKLDAMGPGLAGALATLAIDRQQPLPEVVFTEILPDREPVFLTLRGLRLAELDERRRAARELVEHASRKPLGRLALWRLASQMVEESDALVWQSVLAAIASDGSASAVELVRLAIGHPAAEVRRRACEHLAAHPDPAHAPLLLPALEDSDEGVVRKAIAAMVACGPPGDTQPIAKLLASPSEPVRLDAAAALVRWGDSAGVEELLRLARHRDAAVRQQAAAAMGELGDRRFLPTLIGLLDDHLSIRRVALAGLPKVAGCSVPHPPQHPPRNSTEEASLWKQWFAERHVQTNSGGSPGTWSSRR